MSGSASGRSGGTPSTTTPIAGPWLSPQVVKRNSVPNVLPAIARDPASLSSFPRKREPRATTVPLTLDPRFRGGDEAILPSCAPSSHDRNVAGVGAFHADDVIAAIDVVHLPGDPGRQITQQINPGAADILDRDVALQRPITLVPFEVVV